MKVDTLKEGLTEARRRRVEADRQREQATGEMAAWLKRVAETDEITMQEAADILGISRVMAYKIVKGESAAKGG